MAIACVRTDLFILLLVTSTASEHHQRLADAACLDDTCSSSLESISRGKTSMLQQNVIRSAAAESHHPEVASSSAREDTEEDIIMKTDEPAQKPKSSAFAKKGNKKDPDPYVDSALIDRTHKVIMGWTPRAACTAAIHMFFQSAGMYTPEEQQRWPWVHDYREALGDTIKPRESDMANDEFLKFKVVRNPYTRAISSWAHQTGTDFSYDTRIQDLAAANGMNNSATYVEWLRFVNNVGWMQLDQHSFPQFSFWELSGGRYDMILQLEDGPEFFRQLDEINGFYKTQLKFRNFGSLAAMIATSKNISQRPNDGLIIDSEQYKIKHGHDTPEEIYTQYPEAIGLVEEIYGDDFNAYGYPRDVTKVYETAEHESAWTDLDDDEN